MFELGRNALLNSKSNRYHSGIRRTHLNQLRNWFQRAMSKGAI